MVFRPGSGSKSPTQPPTQALACSRLNQGCFGVVWRSGRFWTSRPGRKSFKHFRPNFKFSRQIKAKCWRNPSNILSFWGFFNRNQAVLNRVFSQICCQLHPLKKGPGLNPSTNPSILHADIATMYVPCMGQKCAWTDCHCHC